MINIGLLDLPPEFFANVMRLCADKNNVCGVSKQRVTYSKFSCSAIHLHASQALCSVSGRPKCEIYESD